MSIQNKLEEDWLLHLSFGLLVRARGYIVAYTGQPWLFRVSRIDKFTSIDEKMLRVRGHKNDSPLLDSAPCKQRFW